MSSTSFSWKQRQNLTALANLFQSIETMPTSKADLINCLKNNKSVQISESGSKKTMLLTHSFLETKLNNSKAAIKQINGLTPEEFDYVLTKISYQYEENKKNRQLAISLINRLKRRYPEEDIEIPELVKLEKECFAIKFYLCGEGCFWTSFEGSFKDLEEELSAQIENKLEDLVTCPFCKTTNIRHHLYLKKNCQCDAQIVRETAHIHGKVISPLEKQLNQFKNQKDVICLGKGKTNYKMWFIKPGLDLPLNYELRKYAGQTIFDVSDPAQKDSVVEALTEHLTEIYFNGFDENLIASPPIKKALPKIGRNEPCFCGSNIKYKKCCLSKETQQEIRHYSQNIDLEGLGLTRTHKRKIRSEFINLSIKPKDNNYVIPDWETMSEDVSTSKLYITLREAKAIKQIIPAFQYTELSPYRGSIKPEVLAKSNSEFILIPSDAICINEKYYFVPPQLTWHYEPTNLKQELYDEILWEIYCLLENGEAVPQIIEEINEKIDIPLSFYANEQATEGFLSNDDRRIKLIVGENITSMELESPLISKSELLAAIKNMKSHFLENYTISEEEFDKYQTQINALCDQLSSKD